MSESTRVAPVSPHRPAPDRRAFLTAAAGALVAGPAAVVASAPEDGPEFDPTCAACRLNRGRGQPDSHARHLLWEQARGSEANHAVNRLLSLLEEASELIGTFADRHGDGCPCVFCVHNDWDLTCNSHELFGLQWVLDMGIGILENLAIRIGDREAADDGTDAPRLVAVGVRS